MGGDFLYSVIALEEMTKTNHYGLDAFLHSDIVVPYIESYGTEEQKKRYLPACVSGDIVTAVAMTEPGTGSDLASISTTAEESGDVVILNGVKTFISNGVHGDLVIVAGRDTEEKNPHRALSLFLVEDGTAGFKKGPAMGKLGARSQDTAELFFTNCRIPMKNRLGGKGEGFTMLMEKLQQERLLVSILSLVMAEFALGWTTGEMKKKAAGKAMGQADSFAIVEMWTEVKMSRSFLDSLIVDHMNGQSTVMETSMAKYWNSEMANRVLTRCLDLIGRETLAEACPIVRTFRDARVTPIFAGTNEIMKGIVAKSMNL
jgi:alkylation response protein AidB-like acyl-CoA dehydrogenase